MRSPLNILTIFSAVPRDEIISYFHECGFQEVKAGKFTDHQSVSIEVQATVCSSKLSSLFKIFHTPVIFKGPQKKIEKIRDTFRMKFLCAGG